MAEKVTLKAFLVQGACAMSIAYLTSLTGFIYAWPSLTVSNYVSNDTVLSYPMSSTEISLLGSLTNIGALVTTPFCGYIVNKIGRKYSAMLFGLPFVLCWAIISVTSYPPFILAAIGISGAGAAGQAISSVYIGEISQDSIRGALTSTCVSGYFTGLLFSYIIGGALTYQQTVYIQLTLCVLYMVFLMFLKESPVYWMQIGNEEEAAKSIAFYRQVDVKSKEVEIEIRKIKLQLDPRLELMLQEENDPEAVKDLLQKKIEPVETKHSDSQWKFLMKSKSSQRALIAVLVIMALTILMGSIVLQVYAEPLFKEAVPSLPSNLCAIFLAIDFLAASVFCALVVDMVGRKFLLVSTSAVTGLLTAALGLQLHLHVSPHWVTAFLIYTTMFVYTIGAATVPFILTSEVFLPEVRGLCNSISMACMWIMNFVTLIVFNPVVERFGLGPAFYGFAVVCFLGALYGQLYLPETKGLSADAIQLLFLKEKSTKNRKNSVKS